MKIVSRLTNSNELDSFNPDSDSPEPVTDLVTEFPESDEKLTASLQEPITDLLTEVPESDEKLTSDDNQLNDLKEAISELTNSTFEEVNTVVQGSHQAQYKISPDEQKVLDALPKGEPKFIEEICIITRLSNRDVLSCLTLLELKGLVTMLKGKSFIKLKEASFKEAGKGVTVEEFNTVIKVMCLRFFRTKQWDKIIDEDLKAGDFIDKWVKEQPDFEKWYSELSEAQLSQVKTKENALNFFINKFNKKLLEDVDHGHASSMNAEMVNEPLMDIPNKEDQNDLDNQKFESYNDFLDTVNE